MLFSDCSFCHFTACFAQNPSAFAGIFTSDYGTDNDSTDARFYICVNSQNNHMQGVYSNVGKKYHIILWNYHVHFLFSNLGWACSKPFDFWRVLFRLFFGSIYFIYILNLVIFDKRRFYTRKRSSMMLIVCVYVFLFLFSNKKHAKYIYLLFYTIYSSWSVLPHVHFVLGYIDGTVGPNGAGGGLRFDGYWYYYI